MEANGQKLTASMHRCILFILLCPFLANAQDQLQMVLLRHDQVVARFSIGDIVQVKLKDKRKKEGRIVELNEFSMITSSDTIAFSKILHIRGKGEKRSFNRGIGGLLFVGGIVYFTVDQLNAAFGYNNGASATVAKTSAILSAAGLLLILSSPRYTKMKPGTIIRVIDYKSKFYR